MLTGMVARCIGADLIDIWYVYEHNIYDFRKSDENVLLRYKV